MFVINSSFPCRESFLPDGRAVGAILNLVFAFAFFCLYSAYHAHCIERSRLLPRLVLLARQTLYHHYTLPLLDVALHFDTSPPGSTSVLLTGELVLGFDM